MRVAKTKVLICAFVFAYANCWLSHEAVRIIIVTRSSCNITQTYQCNVYPFTPHFYIRVIYSKTGVYSCIHFSYFLSKT